MEYQRNISKEKLKARNKKISEAQKKAWKEKAKLFEVIKRHSLESKISGIKKLVINL